jgi:hypothetical protein
MSVRVLYREEARTKCPACQRNIAAVRASNEEVLRVARHLYQEEAPNVDGHHTLDAGGFCPGSMEHVVETIDSKKKRSRP